MTTVSQDQQNRVGLNNAELSAWHRDGYHVERGLFSADEASRVADRFDALARTGRAIDGHWAPDPAGTDALARYPRVMQPHEFDPESLALLLDARVRAVLRQLLGEDAVACQTMFYFKPPGARGQAFHQDNYYLRVQPATCVAAWLAVDRSHPGNGGLQVCPGTHNLDLQCPERADLTTSFIDDLVAPPPGCEPAALTLEPGDMLFFPGSMIHGSTPNGTTDEWRRSFISHYMPRSATQIGGWYLPHLYDFDGQRVSKDSTTWGGPCGDDGRSIAGTFH